jgi:SnoaL-like domain
MQVNDELAIRELAARYSDAVNRGASVDMTHTYANGGVLDAFGAAPIVGHEQLLATFAKVVADHQWVFQMTHSGIVVVDGDSAKCRWWVSENALRKGGGGTVFLGSYEDDVVRTASGWRYSRRQLNAVYLGRTAFPGKTFSRSGFVELPWER